MAKKTGDTNSIQINLKDTDDVINGKSCHFGKAFSFKKGYVQRVDAKVTDKVCVYA